MSFSKQDAIDLAKTQEETIVLRYELYVLHKKSTKIIVKNMVKRFLRWLTK